MIGENFDGIDLNELFNDFNEIPRELVAKNDFKTTVSQDDLTEFTANDCTAPRRNQKRSKSKKTNQTKQTTMYDYAASISYKHKRFYSSLDNTTTTKTIIKGQKRPWRKYVPSSSILKKSKSSIRDDLSPSTSPDLIDQLLRYLDERSRNITEEEPLKKIYHTSKTISK